MTIQAVDKFETRQCDSCKFYEDIVYKGNECFVCKKIDDTYSQHYMGYFMPLKIFHVVYGS